MLVMVSDSSNAVHPASRAVESMPCSSGVVKVQESLWTGVGRMGSPQPVHNKEGLLVVPLKNIDHVQCIVNVREIFIGNG